MDKFTTGAIVYHPHHGPGIIVDIRRLAVGGASQRYYIIELTSGNKLMLPVEQGGHICSLKPLRAFRRVLLAAPTDLATNYHQRQGEINNKLSGGDQLQIAAVLRDLIWREHSAKLTKSDKALVSSLKKRIVNILSIQTDLDSHKIARWLEMTLEKFILSRSTVSE